jgi:hypothetical protein
MYGASDCNTCHPGNETWREWAEARDEHEEHMAVMRREEQHEANAQAEDSE